MLWLGVVLTFRNFLPLPLVRAMVVGETWFNVAKPRPSGGDVTLSATRHGIEAGVVDIAEGEVVGVGDVAAGEMMIEGLKVMIVAARAAEAGV